MGRLILFVLVIWIIGAYMCSDSEPAAHKNPTIESYIKDIRLSNEVEEVFRNPWTNR
jgi:hypothetical protein